jgi:hypothetical protein
VEIERKGEASKEETGNMKLREEERNECWISAMPIYFASVFVRGGGMRQVLWNDFFISHCALFFRSSFILHLRALRSVAAVSTTHT